MNWWLLTSQTSSSLASKVLNFWVLSLDQVIVILLSIVNVTSKFLEDKEWFKFGVVMTCCHYVIFRTYFDNLIEFWGNMRWLGVLKARKSEELKATNRVTIFTTVTRFYHQRSMLFEPLKSWYDFWWRGAILWTVVRFRRVQNCLFKLKSVPNTKVTIFGDLKCDFETWRLFEGRFLHPLLSSCMF